MQHRVHEVEMSPHGTFQSRFPHPIPSLLAGAQPIISFACVRAQALAMQSLAATMVRSLLRMTPC